MEKEKIYQKGARKMESEWGIKSVWGTESTRQHLAGRQQPGGNSVGWATVCIERQLSGKLELEELHILCPEHSTIVW